MDAIAALSSPFSAQSSPFASDSALKGPPFSLCRARTAKDAAFLSLNHCFIAPEQRKRRFCGLKAVSGQGDDDSELANGFGVLVDHGMMQDDLTQYESGKNGDFEQPDNLAVGSRAGLFRTPISGGVQSATMTHNLPSPALAVRNLMEQAQFGQLCTVMSKMHHHRTGYPFGSLVDFAPDPMGHPILSLSPLAIHTRNLLADPRCSLVVQIPGWNSLSNARVTLFGDIFPVPSDQQEWARQQFTAKHQRWTSHQWGNFHYFTMKNISDIYFVGGFGTVAWINVKEYETTLPDKIAAEGVEQNLKELNAIFSKPLKEILSVDDEIDDVAFISIDSKGTDIRVREGVQFNVQRISFEVDHEVQTLEEAKAALGKIVYGDEWKS